MGETLENVEKTVKADVIAVTKETTVFVEKVHQAIETWFVKHFHNNPISRNGEVINKIIEAKDDLKQEISKL